MVCYYNDDVIKWIHFPSYWPFVRGIHLSPVNSPHKGQWRGALVFSLICVWKKNAWVHNRGAGDLRRHLSHYDVIVMISSVFMGGGGGGGDIDHCPACRTSLIATRFWVVLICPIIKCLTVLRVFFYFVWFEFIHHNFQLYFELCTYCNVLDIYLSQNLNFVNYLLFYMKLLNYLFVIMFGSVLGCCELTGVSLL